MRSTEVKESYKSGFTSEKDLSIGDQMAYEWEQDFIAMKWAISYLSEYFEYRNKTKTTPHTFGDNTANQAFDVLLKRVSKYSCPSNLKDKYKTKEKCPLGDACKCCAVSDK